MTIQQMMLSTMVAADANIIKLTSRSVSAQDPTFGGSAWAGVSFGNTGQLTTFWGQSTSPQIDFNISGEWATQAVSGGDYSVRATLNSGVAPSGGALGSWLVLNFAQGWTLTRSSNGSSSCSLFVEIRRNSDSTVLASATIDLFATVGQL